MRYVNGISKTWGKPEKDGKTYVRIPAYQFKAICIEHNFDTGIIQTELAKLGYYHDGHKIWTLARYIDLAAGKTVQGYTWSEWIGV